MAENLVIYYSRKGENYFGGTIRSISKGNTEIVAEFIANAVDADLFEVETIKEYSKDYTTCTEEAQAEIRSNARPELKKYLDSIEEYDNIFVAGPCWWGTYPMAVFSAIDRLNFEGKKVIAVMTHEGSGLGNSERDLKKHCAGATFGKGLAVRGSDVKSAQSRVAQWAKEQVE